MLEKAKVLLVHTTLVLSNCPIICMREHESVIVGKGRTIKRSILKPQTKAKKARKPFHTKM